MYKIKQQPEDFVVKEIFNPQTKEQGDYAYFILTKKNRTTLDAVQNIANALRMPFKHIGYAGTKDKHAITVQICSVKNRTKEQLEKIKLKDIELTFAGYADKPVSLGDHEGNNFVIVIRNITAAPKPTQSKQSFEGHRKGVTKFINYFGEQRFSTNNAEIGKLIVQKKFKETAEALKEEIVKNYIEEHPTDFIGALKTLPIKQLKFHIHAYQAKLWNEMAANTTELTLPLIGFGTNETRAIKEVLTKEGITTRDFIIKPFPELSSEGNEREVFCEVKNLQINKLEDDELNEGMKKITLEFQLKKGSYATEFVRQLFK